MKRVPFATYFNLLTNLSLLSSPRLHPLPLPLSLSLSLSTLFVFLLFFLHINFLDLINCLFICLYIIAYRLFYHYYYYYYYFHKFNFFLTRSQTLHVLPGQVCHGGPICRLSGDRRNHSIFSGNSRVNFLDLLVSLFLYRKLSFPIVSGYSCLPSLIS